MLRSASVAVLFAAGAALLAVPAFSAEIEIKMLNRGSDGQVMVFEPMAVRAEPGDTIHFVPVDMGHDAFSMVVPDGVADVRGAISREVTVTADKPGAYLFKCAPHFGMGMVALVVVGDNPANLDAVRQAKLPKLARDRLDAGLVKLGF